ncbi:MAG TPA: PH domain-containing protein, partial [Candidatus Binatia bacterium]|nr:PH domain-containing protein [Candidatus Binatia bacterium]
MVHISVIQSQLTKLGIHLSRWFMPELKELQQLLMDDEEIIACAPGRYFSGVALLVATDKRLLLIDKRTFFMTVEDTRYDMISEINFSTRFYDTTIHIFTLNKQHNFSSIKYRQQLRDLTSFVQQKVWQLRQYQPQAGSAPAPLVARSAQPYTPAPQNQQASSSVS